jgi:hypothetical protein
LATLEIEPANNKTISKGNGKDGLLKAACNRSKNNPVN